MIRIVNTTGRADDTRVLDAATGEDITERLRIFKILLVQEAGKVPEAILYCFSPDMDLVSEIANIKIEKQA